VLTTCDGDQRLLPVYALTVWSEQSDTDFRERRLFNSVRKHIRLLPKNSIYQPKVEL
jgi:hypothetical protein